MRIVHKPKDDRSFITIPFFLISLGLGIKLLSIEVQRDPYRILVILILLCATAGSFLVLYWHIMCSFFVELKENSFIAKNALRIKRGEMKYDEILEIYSAKINKYDIILKNRFNKKLIVNLGMDKAEDFLNFVLSKATNCKKIDLIKIKDLFPNIDIYKL